MVNFVDLLTEGVQDKGIFKAVFMAGGPGSGKSFIAKELFGIPDKFNISCTGLKMINQDKEYKYILKKHNFDPEWLDVYPDDVFDQFSDELRPFAKELAKQREKGYMKGKMGMIIDGTGHKFQKIKAQKKELEAEGYDTHMIFVMTSLEVAQQRNKERDRVLPEKLVKKSWTDTRKNLVAYKSLFGGNFVMVDNSNFLDAKEARHKFGDIAKSYINKWANAPIQNPIGQHWVQDQFKIKNAGIK